MKHPFARAIEVVAIGYGEKRHEGDLRFTDLRFTDLRFLSPFHYERLRVGERSSGMSEQSSSRIYDFATTDDTDKTDVTDNY
jgi:hypothetical protein